MLLPGAQETVHIATHVPQREATEPDIISASGERFASSTAQARTARRAKGCYTRAMPARHTCINLGPRLEGWGVGSR